MVNTVQWNKKNRTRQLPEGKWGRNLERKLEHRPVVLQEHPLARHMVVQLVA